MNDVELRALIASRLQIPNELVTRDADLVADLGADSLSLAELTGLIEDHTGRRLSIAELEEITTVGDLVDLLVVK